MTERFALFLRPVCILLAIGLGSLAFTALTGRSACLFYETTGVPCPSCGMTRAMLRLFHGDCGGAFRYHPLFPIVCVLPFFLFFKWPSAKRTALLSLIAALFVAVWVLRLWLYFPDTAPMTFHDDALLPQLFRLL